MVVSYLCSGCSPSVNGVHELKCPVKYPKEQSDDNQSK